MLTRGFVNIMYAVKINGKDSGTLTVEQIFGLRSTKGVVICGSPGKEVTYATFRNSESVKAQFDKLEGAAKKQQDEKARLSRARYELRSNLKDRLRNLGLSRTGSQFPSDIELLRPSGASTPARVNREEIVEGLGENLEEAEGAVGGNIGNGGSLQNLQTDISATSRAEIYVARRRTRSEERTDFIDRVLGVENNTQFRLTEEERRFLAGPSGGADRQQPSNNPSSNFITPASAAAPTVNNNSNRVQGISAITANNNNATGAGHSNLADRTTPAPGRNIGAAAGVANNSNQQSNTFSRRLNNMSDNSAGSTGGGPFVSFKDAVKYIKPYTGKKEKAYLFVKDCVRAFAKIKPSDRESLFNYVLSQLEGLESELIGNRVFNNWEELHKYLTGNFLKLEEINLGIEMGKFSTLKQGDSEDTQSYFDRAYLFKRRIDLIADKPEHSQFPLLELANAELVRNFVYGAV